MSFIVPVGDEWWIHYCGMCGTSNILKVEQRGKCMKCDGLEMRKIKEV